MGCPKVLAGACLVGGCSAEHHGEQDTQLQGGSGRCGLCAGLGLLQVRWRVMARRA